MGGASQRRKMIKTAEEERQREASPPPRGDGRNGDGSGKTLTASKAKVTLENPSEPQGETGNTEEHFYTQRSSKTLRWCVVHCLLTRQATLVSRRVFALLLLLCCQVTSLLAELARGASTATISSARLDQGRLRRITSQLSFKHSQTFKCRRRAEALLQLACSC